MALAENVKAFIVHMALLILKITIYLASKVQIVLFILEKISILAEYTNFTNIILKKSG